MAEKLGLDAAYALNTPEDSRRLYARWADSYDDGFASAMAYMLPDHVARLFLGRDCARPVLDVGAGTGLVAERVLQARPCEMDALDISGEMLAVAAAKGLYRKTIEADLTGTLPIGDAIYGGIVSSGTFTLGHVGPEAFDELLRVARPGALFVLSVNAEHFEARGFAAKFDALKDRIADLRLETVPIYGQGAADEHAQDKGRIALFRKV